MAVNVGSTNGIFPIHPGDLIEYAKTALTIVIDDIVIARFWYHRSCFTTARIHHYLSALRRRTTGRCTWNSYRSIVLLRSVNPVWILVIYRYLVNLCRRLIKLRRPCLSTIVGYIGTAIVALDQ